MSLLFAPPRPIRQQAQPSSPTAGTRWDELTAGGILANEWYWDDSVNGGSWISTAILVSPNYVTSSINNTGDLWMPGLTGLSGIFLLSVNYRWIGTVDASNFWTLQLFDGPATTAYSSIIINNTNGSTGRKSGVISTSYLPFSGADPHVRWSQTKTGNPAAPFYFGNFTFRVVR